MSAGQGTAATQDLTKPAIARVVMTYRGRHSTLAPSLQIECELYDLGSSLAVHTICPRCANAQWIDSTRKTIHFDRATGELHIEPFTCTWELSPERHHFGVGLCRCRVVYVGHEIRDD